MAAEKSILEVVSEKTLINISSGFKFSNKNPCVFLLVEAIVFINFVVFKDQLIAISEYLYMPCADQVY